MVKYNSDGEKQWTRQFGTSALDIGSGITSDSSGNVYVTGYTLGALDGNTSARSIDLFVVKYNSDGEKQWTQQFGLQAFGNGITSDSSNVYVTGYTEENLNGHINAGGWDLFVSNTTLTGPSNGLSNWGHITMMMLTTSPVTAAVMSM